MRYSWPFTFLSILIMIIFFLVHCIGHLICEAFSLIKSGFELYIFVWKSIGFVLFIYSFQIWTIMKNTYCAIDPERSSLLSSLVSFRPINTLKNKTNVQKRPWSTNGTQWVKLLEILGVVKHDQYVDYNRPVSRSTSFFSQISVEITKLAIFLSVLDLDA